MIINELMNFSSLVLEIWCVFHTESTSSQGLATLWTLSGHVAMAIVVDSVGLKPHLEFCVWGALETYDPLKPGSHKCSSPWLSSWAAWSVSAPLRLARSQIHRMWVAILNLFLRGFAAPTKWQTRGPGVPTTEEVNMYPESLAHRFLLTNISLYPSNGYMGAKNWKHLIFTMRLLISKI